MLLPDQESNRFEDDLDTLCHSWSYDSPLRQGLREKRAVNRKGVIVWMRNEMMTPHPNSLGLVP